MCILSSTRTLFLQFEVVVRKGVDTMNTNDAIMTTPQIFFFFFGVHGSRYSDVATPKAAEETIKSVKISMSIILFILLVLDTYYRHQVKLMDIPSPRLFNRY